MAAQLPPNVVLLRPRPEGERIHFQGTFLERALAIELGRQCMIGVRQWNRLNEEILPALPRTRQLDGRELTDLWEPIQAILVAAGIVRFILWPTPLKSRSGAQKRASEARGRTIVALLGVPESSPLKIRDLRNSLEHFDERIEDHYEEFGPGPHRDFNLVWTAPASFKLPPDVVRAYFVSRNVVQLFQDSVNLQDVAKAMWDLADSFSVEVRTGRFESAAPPGPAIR